jgi:hypothetical protein
VGQSWLPITSICCLEEDLVHRLPHDAAQLCVGVLLWTMHFATSFQPPAAIFRVAAVVEVNTPVSTGDEFLSSPVLQAGDKPPRSIINSLSGTILAQVKTQLSNFGR